MTRTEQASSKLPSSPPLKPRERSIGSRENKRILGYRASGSSVSVIEHLPQISNQYTHKTRKRPLFQARYRVPSRHTTDPRGINVLFGLTKLRKPTVTSPGRLSPRSPSPRKGNIGLRDNESFLRLPSEARMQSSAWVRGQINSCVRLESNAPPW